jgi:hypothetical protein
VVIELAGDGDRVDQHSMQVERRYLAAGHGASRIIRR